MTDARTDTLPFTLIIPAHNEEAVIARCLKTAMAGAGDCGAMEIVVAANGCSDRTVEIARAAAPQAIVLDLPAGSKTAAINAANRVAGHYPRIVLDADVECGFSSLTALVSALQDPAILCVAPSIRLNLDGCNGFVRAYYAAWSKQPYARSGRGGAGCYGLSKQALEQVGEFPPIIGDDIWIHTRFPDTARRLVERDSEGHPVYSIVRPPRTAWQQVQVEARRMIGNAEVKRDYPSPYLALPNKGGGLSGSLRSGASPLELLAFLGVKALVRLEMLRRRWRGNTAGWTRDLSSREG